MLTKNKWLYYWRTNEEWYDYDDYDNPILTDKAPEEARRSMEAYKKKSPDVVPIMSKEEEQEIWDSI